jgi:predicted kinase
MELILLIGIQATGKSTFSRERFFDSHVRLNLDSLRTRRRESILWEACLESKTPVVVDNTNVTRKERARYIKAALAARYKVIGYYFESRLAQALTRNEQRQGRQKVPRAGILGTSAKLELPDPSEGFSELYYVRLLSTKDQPVGFAVEPWKNEQATLPD